jgi:hypothetical protein
MSSWSIAEANLTSVGVLAFAFGFLASRLKSDVRLPDAIYQFLSVYLLFGIGLKGGHSLKETSAGNLITPVLATVICGVLIPCLAFVILRLVKGLNNIDRGSFAAHYGSTSLVTFSAGILFLESNGIFVEGFAPALLTVMEIPGLIVGISLPQNLHIPRSVGEQRLKRFCSERQFCSSLVGSLLASLQAMMDIKR